MKGEVVDVEVRRTEAVQVTYADGEVAVFPVAELRAVCPCAGCRGKRERGTPVWPVPGGPSEITVDDAELVGAWGISLRWSDGHDTGIFSWDALRDWWDAGRRGPLVHDPGPER